MNTYRVDRAMEGLSPPCGMNSILYIGDSRKCAEQVFNHMDGGKDSWNQPNRIEVFWLTERYEELEEAQQSGMMQPGDVAEMLSILSVLNDIKGVTGDEKWRDDWYPELLVRDSHYKSYMQELLRDCGDMPTLPTYIVVDWDATIANLRVDWTSIDIDGVTYWYR